MTDAPAEVFDGPANLAAPVEDVHRMVFEESDTDLLAAVRPTDGSSWKECAALATRG